MKDLIVIPGNIDEIRTLNADSFLIGCEEYSVRTDTSFSLEEIRTIKQIVTERNKNLYILINKIFLQDETEGLYECLGKLKEIGFDGIFFSDMAIMNLAKKLDITDKLVYFSETQNVNYKDSEFFLNQGLKGVIMSKEVPLDDIIHTSENVKGNVGMIIHGYLHMFYSKRKILRNFFNKYEINYDYKNRRTLRLKEQKRDEYYPIYEDSNGSYIFGHGCMSSLNDFDKIVKSDISMMIIDSIFLTPEHVERALTYYRNIMDGKNDDYQKLLEDEFSDVTFNSGFLHHATGIYK